MEMLTNIDLNKEYNEILKSLKMLGLTVYEAKTFLGLIYHNSANADIIASVAKIPRPSTYKVLESLEKKGFVKSLEGRPRMFKIENMEMLEERYKNIVSSLFSKLKLFQDLVSEKGEPQLVYTIYGKAKVIEKIGEFIDQSESEVLLSSPKLIEIKSKLSKNIRNAIKRNVKVVVITVRTQRPPPNTEFHYNDGLIATDIVCDEKKALIADAELEACGYSDNPALAQHLRHFIEIMLFRE